MIIVLQLCDDQKDTELLVQCSYTTFLSDFEICVSLPIMLLFAPKDSQLYCHCELYWVGQKIRLVFSHKMALVAIRCP